MSAPLADGPSKTVATHPRDVYFLSPVLDVLLAGGALSLAVFVAFAFALRWTKSTSGLEQAAFVLGWAVNWPHFAATSVRLYQSVDRMVQFPKTAFATPVLVALGTAWAVASPDGFAPWWVKAFLVWSPYHYAGQTKGISLLYARRLGVNVDAFARRLIVISSYGSYAYLLASFEARRESGKLGDVSVPTLYSLLHRAFPRAFSTDTLPDALVTPLQAISWAIVAVTLAALVLLAWRCWTRDGRVPLAALVPIASQLVWFVPGSGVDAEAFALFVPTFHGLQYLVIAWVFQLKEQSARPGFRPGVPRVLLETAQWAIASGVGAFLMFYLLPRAVPALAHAQTNLAGPCIVAGFQIHHFFVDGVIWKIRDPRVRASLAGNLLDLAGFAR